jgi:phospholipid/cholesterol/gamma-HCH transport system permease protein
MAEKGGAEEGWIEAKPSGGDLAYIAGGYWLISAAPQLDRQLLALERAAAPTAAGRQRVRIDCAPLEALDTVGAWLILRLKTALGRRGADVSLDNLAPRFAPLLTQAEKYEPEEAHKHRRHFPGPVDLTAALGAAAVAFVRDAGEGLGFLGEVTLATGRVLSNPRRLRPIAFLSQMQHTGPAAMPIIGLLSFLIGIVFAYQGAAQLRQFGAEIFTVNLLGIAFMRELGVLLSAIIVAGRSGSAFTAEIGTMQVNEEIDAMTTIGLDPVEVLVLPRVFGLVLTLPLLVFYADAMGLIGGCLMTWATLGIPVPGFLDQLRGAITEWTLWVGVIKAPFFAAIIAMVGCYEGFNVAGSADSVGRLTTQSVVESIFLVIVADAAFSIMFSILRI